MLDKEYLIKELNRIVDKLIKKNTDYGDSFFTLMDEYGFPAFTIRLTDKLARIKTLDKRKKAEVKNESIEDTIDDIIGYCMLYKHYIKDKFKNDKEL